MADDGFDAGSIFVQVVPSFRDTQRIIGSESKKWGDQVERDLSDGMERGAEKGAKKAAKKLEGLTDEVGKNADKSGQESAERYAGSFRTTLQKAIASMEKEIKPIELSTASTKTLSDLDKVKAKLKELSETKIEPGMDVRGLLRQAAEVEAAIKAISQDVDIDVKWDTNAALRQWRSMIAEMEKFAPKIEPKADFKPAERQLGAFEQKFKDAVGRAAKSIGDQSSPELLKLRKRLEDLGDVEIGIDLSAADAMAELDAIHLEVAQLNGTTAEINVRVDSNAALKAMTAAVREVDTLDGKTKQIEKSGGILGRLFGKGKGGAANGDVVANAFRSFNGVLLASVTLGPALVPILAAITGGLAAVGPAALAGAAGLGTLVLAFGGIGDAISALSNQEQTAAKDSVSAARTMRNAAQGVEDAQRSLTRARRDAKQSGLDAAKAVADAEEEAAKRNVDAAKRVASAREQAAEAYAAAVKRQGDAEKRLADTQRDAKKAQDDLAEARRQAQKDLDDIADKSKQNALDIRQATIDLFDATVANNATQADPGATNKEKEQADINLKQAQLRLEELRDTRKDLAEQKTKADKTGVNGTDRVVQAQERLNDALEKQKDAQDDVAQSAIDLRKTQKDGIQAVNDAVAAQKDAIEQGKDSVAAALENQRRTSVANQESIADATRGLERAQQAYNDALYDTGVQGSAAAQKVKDAFANLGPEAAAFAKYIFGLRDEFYKLRAVAAAGLLPGVQDTIQLLIGTYGPQLTKFVGDLSSTFGQLARDLGTTLTGDTFKSFFAAFEGSGPKIVNNFGQAFLSWLDTGAQIMKLSLPTAEKFAGWIQDISDKVNKWSKSPEGLKILGDFFAYVDKIAPEVEAFFEALGKAFIAIVKALAPLGEDILNILTNFLNWIAAMDPKTLQFIVTTILALVAAFQLTSAAIFIVGGAINFVLSPFELIIAAIVAVVVGLVVLYQRSETFRDIVNAVFTAVGAIATWLFDNILKPAFAYTIWIWGVLGKAFSDVWNTILKPVFTAIGNIVAWLWKKIIAPYLTLVMNFWKAVFTAMKWAWDNILWPVIKVIAKIVWELWLLGFKVAFDAIALGWKVLSAGLKWVWDHVLKPLFDIFMDVIGDKVVKAFKDAVDLIKKHWDTIKDIAMTPISFVVDIVLNKGLIAGFNKLADVFHMDKVDPIPWPPKGFATGGVYPGYTPGRDIGYIGVSGGEAIMRPEWTRAMRELDPAYIDEANRRARTGGVGAVKRFLGGFKNGGEVQGGSGVGIYDRTTWRGKSLDYYTIQLLQAVEKMTGQTVRISQGSYSTSVAASGSTHAGGGVIDLGWPGGKLGNALVAAMRSVGFAAWHRNPAQGPWNDHIHAVAAGDPTASASAKRQVQDYYNGGNGLGGKDDGPDVKKDPSLLQRILGGIGDIASWAKEAIANPAKWLKSQISDKLGQITEKFGDNALSKLVTKIPESIIEGMVNKIKSIDLNPFGGGSPAKGDVQKMAQEALNNMGWGGYWGDLDWLVSHESSWNPKAKNPASSAYGLFQFLDGTWENGKRSSDPREQIRQGLNYIKSRYGNPANAKAFWEQHHWYKDGGVVPTDGTGVLSTPTDLYDTGGIIPQGLSQVLNLTGGNEHAAVFTTDQWERLQVGGTGDGVHYEPHFYNSDLTSDDVMEDFRFELRRLNRGS